MLSLAAGDASALTVTTDGTPDGQVLGTVSPEALGIAFGDRPHEILQSIRRAANLDELREGNQRSVFLSGAT
jgi:hypothetical protein